MPTPNDKQEKERILKWFTNMKTGLKVETFDFASSKKN